MATGFLCGSFGCIPLTAWRPSMTEDPNLDTGLDTDPEPDLEDLVTDTTPAEPATAPASPPPEATNGDNGAPPPAEPAALELYRGQGAILLPAAPVAVSLAAHSHVVQVIGRLLEAGTDFGKIPGTKKNTLLKPGAEKLNFAFGIVPTYEIIEKEIDHDRKVAWTKRKKAAREWVERSGESVGLYRYVVRCRLVRREDESLIAEGIGSASTMESKYVDRPRDVENTIIKMAEKRALVAATLNAYGLSDRFTQDTEDRPRDGGIELEDDEYEVEVEAPEDFEVPFGRTRGKALKDHTPAELTNLRGWCAKTDPEKFAEIIGRLDAELERRRRNPPESDAEAAREPGAPRFTGDPPADGAPMPGPEQGHPQPAPGSPPPPGDENAPPWAGGQSLAERLKNAPPPVAAAPPRRGGRKGGRAPAGQGSVL